MDEETVVPFVDQLWKDDAACRYADPEIFFPGGQRDDPESIAKTEAALALCQRCPVTAQCLDYAQRLHLDHGIYGGLSARARHRLREGQRRAPTNLPRTRGVRVDSALTAKLRQTGLRDGKVGQAWGSQISCSDTLRHS